MKKTNAIILMSLFTVKTFAATDNQLLNDFFLGVKSGYQILDDDKSHSERPDASIIGVYGGLHMTDNLSWDLGYQYWGGIHSDKDNVDADLLELALRYDNYISNNVSLYARAGLAYVWGEIDSPQVSEKFDNVSPLGELGVNYWLTDKLSTGVSYQYVRGVGGHHDLNIDSHSANLSLTYHFTSQYDYHQAGPVQLAPIVKPVTIIELQSMTLFDFDSAELKPLGREHLKDLAMQINPHSKVRFTIIGHTDSTGFSAYNLELSTRRAQSVKNYLSQLGLNNEYISVEGRGESQPISSNSTKQGREKNRRVEVIANYYGQ